MKKECEKLVGLRNLNKTLFVKKKLLSRNQTMQEEREKKKIIICLEWRVFRRTLLSFFPQMLAGCLL